jgi:diguanylate cyclase (GGDEF)-like protein
VIRTQPIAVRPALREFRASFSRKLRFDDEREQRFMAKHAADRLSHFLSTGVAALVMFNLFLITDWYMVPDVFALSVKLRLGFLSPLVLTLVTIGTLCRQWWLRHTPPAMVDAIGMTCTILVAACLGVILMSTNSLQVPIYRAGLIPVLVFGNLLQRLRFRYAVASSIFIILVYVCSMIVAGDRPDPYCVLEVPLGLLLVIVAIYTLMSTFKLELDERMRFLQTERSRVLLAGLERTNRELEELSKLDALTGLANRRWFDAFLADVLSARAGQSKPGVVSMLLMDVDHFKAFNDHYGHPAGDQCLMLIARALQTQLEHEDCLVARWGGEEFAVVMPAADERTAMQVAEKLRQAVEALAMRHEVSVTASYVTISVGVTTRQQTDSASFADQLIASADKALYQAKNEGRNRCALLAFTGLEQGFDHART